MIARRIPIVLTALALFCTDPIGPAGNGVITVYGAEGVVATVGPDRLTIDTNCGGGSTNGPLQFGPDGSFTADGDFYFGPVVPLTSPAHFRGTLLGQWLVLDVWTLAAPDAVYRYRLRRGAGEIGIRCL
ncbi:MAG: hypothetical protein AB7I33_05425 [Gemmatimonadales bacterium]